MPRSPFEDFRRFYREGGFVKPKVSTSDRLQRINLALYGSQNYDRPAELAGGGDAIKGLIRGIRNKYGKAHADRLVHAADVSDLSSYEPAALKDMFVRNPGLMTTMKPGDFENYARPIAPRFQQQVPYSRWDNVPDAELPPRSQQTFDNYVDNIKDRIGTIGMQEPPTLWLGRQSLEPSVLPRIIGHEGRHRMRGLESMGNKPTLLHLQPDDRGLLQRYNESKGKFVNRDPIDTRDLMIDRYFPGGDEQRFIPELLDPKASPRPPISFTDDIFADGGPVRMSVGGDAFKQFIRGLKKYKDPASKIDDWKWRPVADVAEQMPREIPPHVLQFGDYMDTMAKKAGTEGLDPRDVLKAYTTTLSSIQRGAVNREALPGLRLSSTEQMIRPEGAFSDWLGSPMGQKYLRYGSEGEAHPEAIADAMKQLNPYGLMPTLGERMAKAPGIVQGNESRLSELVDRASRQASDPSEWRGAVGDFQGIGPSKAGFFASLLGRGDIPTLDARQIVLHTGEPTKAAKPWLKGPRAIDAVDRLAGRQSAMDLYMPPKYRPFDQHLTHHTVWDAAGNEATTHQDVIDSMLNRRHGGPVPMAGGGEFFKQMMRAAKKAPRNEENLIARAARENPHRTPEELITAVRSKDKNVKKWGDTYTERGVTDRMGTDQIANATADIVDPTPPIIRGLTPMDLYGNTAVAGMADRSVAGSAVRSVDGMRFKDPILTQGGMNFPLYHDELWAADKGPITSFANALKGVDARGKPIPNFEKIIGDPLFMTKMMGYQGLDQSNMAMQGASQMLRQAPVDVKDAATFRNFVRNQGKFDRETGEKIRFLPDFPGIKSENLTEWLLQQPMSDRASLIRAMDNAEFNKMGIPNPAGLRLSITDPKLYHAPTNTPGATIGRFDIDNPHVMDPAHPHPSYPVGLRGDYMGRFDKVVPWQNMFPDFAEKVAGKPVPRADRAYQLSPVVQRFDQKWLDQIMPVYENAPQWRDGGRVTERDYELYHPINYDDWSFV